MPPDPPSPRTTAFIEELLNAEAGKRWISLRKRARPASEDIQPPIICKRSRKATGPCPHSMSIVRPSRQLAPEGKQCPICLEDFFASPDGRDRVIPVKLGCQHIFCRECIESHLSSHIRCPLPWCEARCGIQPNKCDLCAYWEKTHPKALVVTVRAQEMASSINNSLMQLALEDDFFKLPKKAKDRFMAHVRHTLTRYEWQFHPGVDLAELLDPFLLAVDRAKAYEYYGGRLSAPAPNPSMFAPRENDPDDYPAGHEPWVAGFLRQWALDFEEENGEVKDGWGVWAKKMEKDASESWEWPYKRVLAHKTGPDGNIQYLVKWVGNRYPESWVSREQLAYEARIAYDRTHGIQHDEHKSPDEELDISRRKDKVDISSLR